MPSPNYLDHVPDQLVDIFTTAELEIIKRITNRLIQFKIVSGTDAYQLYRMQELGRAYDDILEVLTEATGMSKDVLIDTLNDAGVKTLRADDALHRAAGNNPTPMADSPAMQSILMGGYNATMGEFKNLCSSAAYWGSEQLGQILDTAWLKVSSGLWTYDRAIKYAVSQLTQSGLVGIRYISDKGNITFNYLDTVVRRAVLTGVNQAACGLQIARMAEMGTEFVEVTAHAGARPEHALWQGKIYKLIGSTPDFSNFYVATGYGTGAGLAGWNCRHGFYPYYPGISKPANTVQYLRKLNEKTVTVSGKPVSIYTAMQMLRYNERQIRMWKRRAVASGYDTEFAEGKIAEWQARQRELIAETGLRRDYTRERAGRQYTA